MEHHANLLPWQQLCERTGATLRWLGLTDDGRLDLSDLDTVVNERTKLVAVTQQSNILGTINPLERDRRPRRTRSARCVLVDGAQSVPHQPVDVTGVGADFLVFSGHKMLGPDRHRRAVGPVRRARRAAAVPHRRVDDRGRADGGQHLRRPAAAVRGRRADDRAGDRPRRRRRLPARRSAWTTVEEHEKALTGYALEKLQEIPGVTVIGPPDTVARGGAVSFTVEGIHPHDVGQVLDDLGIAVRVGHHCAWPVVRRYGVPATTRATFYVHTGYDDIDALADGVRASPALLRRCTLTRWRLMQLESMYQEIILDHYRNPHGRGLREPFEAEVHHVNPTCGDEVTLRVHLDGDTIADVSYEGMGCSISQASVSAMYDLVIGQDGAARRWRPASTS